MPSQSFVDEGIVRREQLQDGPVLVDDMGEEELGFSAHRLRERFVEIRVGQRVRVDLLEILEPQPLAGEPTCESLRPRIMQHPLDLSLEFVVIGQATLVGELEELVIGRSPPEEE